MAQTLETGVTYQMHSKVNDTRTAAALADTGEDLPLVFGTPFMIADMERACAALIAPLLEGDKVSVGTRIEVSHTAPTPTSSTVTATARFTETEGPHYWFDVWAENAGGRIANGRIARAIVGQETVFSKAAART